MNGKVRFKLVIVWLLAFARCLSTVAQGTAFTYQGMLIQGNSPGNGNYYMNVSLYDAATNGTMLASQFFNTVAVSNGLFTINIDFGASAFDGNPRWLQIGLESYAPSAPWVNLTPRQPVLPAPYAITAANLSGVLPESRLPANV
ncbi:MAG TPA: hypothetical protein VNX28_17950, partial [Gemmataceae bacterium]|nr:hypothetical protein [Gemmataceae bacterium]